MANSASCVSGFSTAITLAMMLSPSLMAFAVASMPALSAPIASKSVTAARNSETTSPSPVETIGARSAGVAAAIASGSSNRNTPSEASATRA